MKPELKWAGPALAALTSAAMAFAACAGQRDAATPAEPQPYWESEIPRDPAYPPGTKVDSWPVLEGDAGSTLIGPADETGKVDGGGTSDRLLWQDVPLPAPPEAQEPHRSLAKGPFDGGGVDADIDASPVEAP